VAVSDVGGSGAAPGVPVVVADGPVTAALDAETEILYVIPFVRPVKLAEPPPPLLDIVGLGTTVPPESVTITVYPTIGEPPVLDGADHVRAKEPELGTAVSPVGDPGGPIGCPLANAYNEAPLAFIAET
jgi:hypothetical protein